MKTKGKAWRPLESRSQRLNNVCGLCGKEPRVTVIANVHLGEACLIRVAAIAAVAGVEFRMPELEPR